MALASASQQAMMVSPALFSSRRSNLRHRQVENSILMALRTSAIPSVAT